MIVATLLAVPAIALLATGTPRQTTALFGNRVSQTGRRALRLAGFALLGASLAAALIDGDRARHLIAYIGTIGIEACIVALIFTVGASSARR